MIRLNTLSTDNFNELYSIDDDELSWQVDYDFTIGRYRVTRFINNHWDGEIVFDEVETRMEKL